MWKWNQIKNGSNQTRSSATMKSTAHLSCLVGVLYAISQEKICWMCRCTFNHFYVIGPKSYRIRWNNANYTAITLFKVTNFGTNWKPICDFLLVININLPPILHHFQVMADYWSNFRWRQSVPHFSALAGDDPLRISG